MASASREELRREFLELLREDEEFRLAVAGLIGLSEILAELRRLREDFSKRFEALERKMIEHDKHFEVLEKKLLEHDKRFEEMNRRFEAIEKKLLEHDKRFEAIERKLLEHDRRFDELNRRVAHVELGMGVLTESLFARFVLDEISSRISKEGDEIVETMRNARVDNTDVDLLIVTKHRVFVVEVKVQPRHSDIDQLLSKAEAIAARFREKTVTPLLAGALIGSEVESYARKRGVEIHKY